MTKKELSQLYYLNREIELIEKQIQEAEYSTTMDSVKGSSINFPYTQHSIKIYGLDIKGLNKLKNKLTNRLNKLMDLRYKTNEYIESVENSETRMILTYRFINGLDWNQVAKSMGNKYTADSVRMKCNRFLGKK